VGLRVVLLGDAVPGAPDLDCDEGETECSGRGGRAGGEEDGPWEPGCSITAAR
jgi:hypothetical protein